MATETLALGVRRVRGGGGRADAVRLGPVANGEFDLRGLRGALRLGESRDELIALFSEADWQDVSLLSHTGELYNVQTSYAVCMPVVIH